MRAMLLLSVWNCQVKYFCLQKSTVPLLMVLWFELLENPGTPWFPFGGCQKPEFQDLSCHIHALPGIPIWAKI